MTEFKRSLAIVIGINEYHNGIASLQTAVSDAAAVAKILEESYQYQLIHPNFKTGIIVNQYARGNCLKTLFTDFLPNQIQPAESDRLLVYFAGHGIARSSDTGPEGYLVPQDGNVNDPDSLLRMGDLHLWLSQLECRHLLVILDCCFAGTFRWAGTRKLIPLPETIHWEHYHRFIKYPAWQVITSAAHNQEALDFLNNRDRGTNREHSPFAEGLIKALGDREADLTADGIITTPELYLYLRNYVELNSQERQTPGFFPLTKHDRGEYIFKLPHIEPQLEPAPKLERDNNPYRGLESFEERHSQLFFGREEVVEELCAQVTRPQLQLTVVLGISGSGKSSIVKAGLIPYLRQSTDRNWQILEPIRPGTNPFSSLARALSFLYSREKTSSGKEVILPDDTYGDEVVLRNTRSYAATSTAIADTAILGNKLQRHPRQFIDLIQNWSQQHPQSRLLLVIDQFEELITLARPVISTVEEQRSTWWTKLESKLGLSDKMDRELVTKKPTEEWHQFVDLLADITKQCPQLSLVITLRSDFEPRFLDSVLQSDWAEARFVVRGMRSDELRDVVEKPATEMALYFEPANLVDRLVDEVAQMPGALPLLSFSLSEMYIELYRAWLEEGIEDRALTVDANFDREGGVAGSLTKRANEEYDNLPDEAHQLTMQRVMLRMVEIQGGEAVKRRVLKRELNYPSAEENKRVKRVLNCLIDTRLMVTGKEVESNRVYYEPAHDFLVRGWDKLQDWLQQGQQQDDLVLQRLLTPAAFKWQSEERSRFYLWNANPYLELLQQILNSEDNWFNQIETEFVQSSITRKRLNVRLRWSGAIAVIMLLSTGLVFALLGQRDAKIGESNAAKQSARVNLNSDRSSLDAMLDSLKAGRTLQHRLLSWIAPRNKDQLQQQIAGALQWSVYQVKELNRMQGTTVPVRSVFNPQSDLLASAEENGRVRLWNLQGQEIADWKADSKRVWVVSFSPDRDYLASGSEDGRIRLWNFQGEPIDHWRGHQGLIRDLSFSNDGKLIASAGGEDGTVGIWNLEGKQLHQWLAHPAPTKNVRFSPDDRLVATTGGDKTIRIWSRQGKLLKQFPAHTWRVIFSPDGRLIASAEDNGFIRLWDRQYREIKSWQADHKRLWNVAFSPDSKTIASAGEDGSARVWDLQGRELARFRGHTGPARSVSFSKDGQILASSGDDGTTRLWTLENRELINWQGNSDGIKDVVFNSQGKLLATAGGDGRIRLWDLQGKQLAVFPQYPASPIHTIGLSPDGRLLASGNRQGNIYLWNLQGELLQTLPTQIDSLNKIIFSPDGKLLVTAGGDGRIRLWNLWGKQLAELSEHEGIVNDLSFSPDGKILASAGEDGTVIAWNWQQGTTKQFQDHIGAVYTVAFSPDNTWLISGGRDSTVRRWNVRNNSTKSPLHIYESRVNSVTYSPDGQTVISSDDRGSVRLWNADSGESLATWNAHRSSIDEFSLNPQGNLLATAGGGEVKLWRIDSFEQLMGQVCSLMQNYLQYNSQVESSDRHLCDRISLSDSR